MGIEAKSTFLRADENFKLFYKNPKIEALKRSSTGILLSLILSIIIIMSLFFLLKTINKQKELAEIKNDLISNITHEFKTPIATVSIAIEAIESFNVLNDADKTQKYLKMSSAQLKKLHQMVEKLLETAALDSESLLLKRENIDVVELLDVLVNKHQTINAEKELNFLSNVDKKNINIDIFHFENAVSNLIDNAIKYGGNKIEVSLNAVFNNIEIIVSDNGNGIEKHQQEKIFDKFYRVPKGNTHNIKGFGIGLYYSKKIIEKHHGNIQLVINNKNTIFKIILPDE
jgi:two-component system phosphate regulon sensor histidine kinase PhoR